MPHHSPRGIPAAALGSLSPIDPTYKAEMYGAGRIPPREAADHWDHSIVKDSPQAPSPLQLPSPQQQQQQRHSPQRTSPYRTTLSVATQPSRITEEEGEAGSLFASSSSSNDTTLHLPPPTMNASARPLNDVQHPAYPAIQHSPENREAAPSDIAFKAPYNFTLYQPRAIDFAEMMMESAHHCIFRRGDCTDAVRARSVCWTCFERVKRLRRRRERWLRRVGLLVWVVVQSAVVGIVVYLMMVERHKRAVRQILHRTGHDLGE